MRPPPLLSSAILIIIEHIFSLPGNCTLFSISLRLRPCYLRIKQLNCWFFFRSAKCLHEKKCCYHYKEVVNYGSHQEYEALRAKRVGTVWNEIIALYFDQNCILFQYSLNGYALFHINSQLRLIEIKAIEIIIQ